MRRKSTAKRSKESTSKESIHKESKINTSKTGGRNPCKTWEEEFGAKQGKNAVRIRQK